MLEILSAHFGKIASALIVAFLLGTAGFARNVDNRLDDHDLQDVQVITKLDALIEDVEEIKSDSARLDSMEKDLKDIRRYLIQVLNR